MENQRFVPLSLEGPNFARPPVVEVACGVQFEDLEQWQTSHYGRFGATIHDLYPATEDQPPLARVQFAQSATFDSQFSLLPPLRRVFFASPPGNFLIQVQPNRFLHNWRKVHDRDEYPRFNTAFDKFIWAWNYFKQFLLSAGFATPKPEIWELTYINHIVGDNTRFPKNMWDYLGFYGTSPEATTPLEASSVAMQIAWPLPDQSGTLSLDVKHGNRVNDQKEVLVLDLTARGPANDGSSSMETWFAMAHDAIVNSFEKLTTAGAHEKWGKV